MISTEPLATTIRSKSRSPGEKRICPALTCSRRPAASIVAICASVRRGKVTSLSPATGGRAGAAQVGSVSLIERNVRGSARSFPGSAQPTPTCPYSDRSARTRSSCFSSRPQTMTLPPPPRGGPADPDLSIFGQIGADSFELFLVAATDHDLPPLPEQSLGDRQAAFAQAIWIATPQAKPAAVGPQ